MERFSYSDESRTYYLAGRPREERELLVLACGFDRCAPDYRVDRQSHPVLVAEYVLRGEGTFRVGYREWALHGGMVFHYGPGTPHSYWTDPRNTLEKVWIAYAGTAAGEITRSLLETNCGAWRLQDPEHVFTLVDAICNEVAAKSLHSQTICDSLLRALLARIAQSRVPETTRAAEPLQSFHRCKAYLDGHYSTMHSPFEVCSAVGISPSYLCRLFRRFSGQSPAAYLGGLKLNSAAYMLISSSLSIKQIATSLAFSDQYNFSRAFKRFYGVSPKAYRHTPAQKRPKAQ
jgi:AraC-like DNA-binding protein